LQLIAQNLFKESSSYLTMDYGFSQRRNKRKNKGKEKRKHPYRKGGSQRSKEKIGHKK